MSRRWSRLRLLWRDLWASHARTKAYINLDIAHILDDLGYDQAAARDVRADGGTDIGSSPEAFDVGANYGTRHRIGLFLGPLLFAVTLLIPTPEGLTTGGQAVAAVTLWVATWWITEAIPIPATSLLPILLLPLTGALSVFEATTPYANPIIFLFIGGFFLAQAMQRWGLHRRIALLTIKKVGTSPLRIILGFMLATAFLSMWVSNTATVMMMLPIGLAVIYQTGTMVDAVEDVFEADRTKFPFGIALMLCIAYSASVGGVATLIGSPPNILFAGQVNELFGETVTFLEWMLYGVPIAIIGLAIVYLYVTKVAVPPKFDQLPTDIEHIDHELTALGVMNRQERWVVVVFAGMATGWIGVSLLDQFDVIAIPANADTLVAIAGALILFTIPTRTSSDEHTFLLDWSTAVKIPWGVIVLFGGGLSIAAGFGATGLAGWIGEQLQLLAGIHTLILLIIVVGVTIFLTEVTSNTATAAILMPVLAGIAIGIGLHPFALMIAGATAASFAFMLPVATPPNAIVFGSGYLTIPQMARVGIGLNLIGVILIALISYYWLPLAWGIDIGVIPPEFAHPIGYWFLG